MTKHFTLIAILVAGFIAAAPTVHSQTASVDYGLTTGEFFNEGTRVANGAGLFELGYFTGYTDVSGLGYFSGKDYSTLRGSFNLLPDSATGVQGNDGQFYQTVDLLSTPGGTRLFAWVFGTAPASAAANWSIISGTIGGSQPSDAAWLAVAPGDPTFNYIELGTVNNVLYARSNPGNSLVPSNFYDPSGANVSVVPEPKTYFLLLIGGAVLLWRARLRCRRAS